MDNFPSQDLTNYLISQGQTQTSQRDREIQAMEMMGRLMEDRPPELKQILKGKKIKEQREIRRQLKEAFALGENVYQQKLQELLTSPSLSPNESIKLYKIPEQTGKWIKFEDGALDHLKVPKESELPLGLLQHIEVAIAHEGENYKALVDKWFPGWEKAKEQASLPEESLQSEFSITAHNTTELDKAIINALKELGKAEPTTIADQITAQQDKSTTPESVKTRLNHWYPTLFIKEKHPTDRRKNLWALKNVTE